MTHPFLQWVNSDRRNFDKHNLNLSTTFKVVTWNINGIRSVQDADNPQCLKELLDSFGADVICLQETKVTRDMLDGTTALVDGYNSYFAFSRSKTGYSGVVTYCKDSATPDCAEEGLSGYFVPNGTTDHIDIYNRVLTEKEFSRTELKLLDCEGRVVITKHTICIPDEHIIAGMTNTQSLVIINVYCPRVDPDKPDRLEYKLKFCHLLELRIKAFIGAGYNVVLVGDLNIVHRAIDTCDDVSKYPEFETNLSRQWLNELLQADPLYCLYSHTFQPRLEEQSSNDDNSVEKEHAEGPFVVRNLSSNDKIKINQSSISSQILVGSNESFMDVENDCFLKDSTDLENIPVMIDSFRYHNKDKRDAYTCWNTKCNARSTNYGTRIDYILTCATTIPSVFDCRILSEVEGSDHCPVEACFVGKFQMASKCPSLCSKYFPEFAGKQVKITTLFQKHQTSELIRTKGDGIIYESKETITKSQVLIKPDLKRKQLKLTSFLQFSAKHRTKVLSSEVNQHGGNTTTTNVVEKNASVGASAGKNASADLWKQLLKGPKPAPLCKGHNEPCVERCVTKKGPNFNRKFWVCARGLGRPDDTSARCNHFLWKK